MQSSQLKPRVTALDDAAIRTVTSTKAREFDFRSPQRREDDAFRQGMTIGMTVATFAALVGFIAAGIIG